MLDQLKWNTLEQRGEMQCLGAFHKIINGKLELDISRYAIKKIDRPRRTHNQQYQSNSKFISTNQFSTSYFPATITMWNQLPQAIVDVTDTVIFKNALLDLDQYSICSPKCKNKCPLLSALCYTPTRRSTGCLHMYLRGTRYKGLNRFSDNTPG